MAPRQLWIPAFAGMTIVEECEVGCGMSKDRKGFVYILASKPHGTLYVGVTSDLSRRVGEHRRGDVEGFTKEHGVKRLVYFEAHDGIIDAIAREKQLKRWKRLWKIRLIEEANPMWRDLTDQIPP